MLTPRKISHFPLTFKKQANFVNDKIFGLMLMNGRLSNLPIESLEFNCLNVLFRLFSICQRHITSHSPSRSSCSLRAGSWSESNLEARAGTSGSQLPGDTVKFWEYFLCRQETSTLKISSSNSISMRRDIWIMSKSLNYVRLFLMASIFFFIEILYWTIAPFKHRLSQVNPSLPKWTQVNPSDPKWTQVYPSEPKWTKVNQSEPKWTQLNLSEPRWTHSGKIR